MSTRSTALLDAAALPSRHDESLRQQPMAGWKEPPMKALPPSFKEYPHLNIERHGVLTEMAPLGTMPTQKQRKAARFDEGKNSVVSKGVEDDASPTLPDVATPERVLEDERPSRRQSVPDSLDDPDYIVANKTPTQQTGRRKSTSRSSVGASPAQHNKPLSASKVVSPSKQRSKRLDKIVRSAYDQAMNAGRLCTAYGLRTIYEEYRGMQKIETLLEAMYTNTATAEQQKQFRDLMSYHKYIAKQNDEGYGELFRIADPNPEPGAMVWKPLRRSEPSTGSGMANSKDHVAQPPSPVKEDNHSRKRKRSSTRSRSASEDTQTREADERMMAHCQRIFEEGAARLQRSRSHSTTSSLSSVDEDLLDSEITPSATRFRHPQSHATTLTDSTSIATELPEAAPPMLHIHAQPIAQIKSLGSNSHALPSTIITTNSNSSSSSTPSDVGVAVSQDTAAMPISIEEASHTTSVTNHLPTPPPISAHHVSTKQQKKVNGSVRRIDENDRANSLRRKAKTVTDYYAPVYDSFIREPRGPATELVSENDAPASGNVAPRSIKSVQLQRLRNVQSRRKGQDEVELPSSPTVLGFQAESTPGSMSNSRAGTPNTHGRPARKVKSGGPRTKSSPMKNKTGPSAGLPRASGERNSPVVGQDDNDDYCSSCGGNGDLVCCDGCTRSFHFRCVDPPMVEGQLPDTWFCNVCNISRNPPMARDSGAFGELLINIEKKNPSAFHLPKEVREYFDGVRTGSEGEYEEGVVTSKAKSRMNFEEVPDYLKLKDTRGNFVLCHNCNQSAATRRPIVQCSYCTLYWHLDCINPPLSNPPPPGRLWRCPAHVDDLLAIVPGALGPAHRYRRIKGASAIKPAIVRGVRNNGHIEVSIDSADEDEEFFEQKEFGHVYRLPESGIKLDFLSKLKMLDAGPVSMPDQRYNRFEPSASSLRTLEERQAALNMVQLARHTNNEHAQRLINTLLAQAPSSVIDLMAQGDAATLSEESSGQLLSQRDRVSLSAMKALIEKRLSTCEGVNGTLDEVHFKHEADDEQMTG